MKTMINEYFIGSVVKVSAKRIALSDYDYNTGMKIHKSFVVDDQTNFENIDKLSEIQKGDVMDVEYISDGDKNIATNLAYVRPRETNDEFMYNIFNDVESEKYQSAG